MSSFRLYSYRDVFNDGDDKLHPGFKISKTLLVLTKTRPFHKRYIPLTGEELQSAHLKPTKCYLTTADNQAAKRYNNARTGELVLPKENVAPLIPTKNFSSLFSISIMSDQTTAPSANTPAAGQAAKIILIANAAGVNRALLLNPTVDAFPDADSGEEVTQWAHKLSFNADGSPRLAEPIEAQAAFDFYMSFVENGVDEASAPFWAIIEAPCTIAHVRGVTDILLKELGESKTVNFNADAFKTWFEAQPDQTLALGIVYDAAFGEGDTQEVAVLEIGSTMHVAATVEETAAAIQTAIENAQPAATTTEGVVDAATVAAETTAPDAAAIETPVVQATTVEDLDTTDGGSAIQAIADQGGLIRAATASAEAAANTFDAIAKANQAIGEIAVAAAAQQRATAAVLGAAGVQTVELPATAPVEEVPAT